MLPPLSPLPPLLQDLRQSKCGLQPQQETITMCTLTFSRMLGRHADAKVKAKSPMYICNLFPGCVLMCPSLCVSVCHCAASVILFRACPDVPISVYVCLPRCSVSTWTGRTTPTQPRQRRHQGHHRRMQSAPCQRRCCAAMMCTYTHWRTPRWSLSGRSPRSTLGTWSKSG